MSAAWCFCVTDRVSEGSIQGGGVRVLVRGSARGVPQEARGGVDARRMGDWHKTGRTQKKRDTARYVHPGMSWIEKPPDSLR